MGEDTIAAIATGMGEAGIGVVRISGPDAIGVGERTFRSRQGSSLSMRPSHRVVYGAVVDKEGRLLDEALAIPMKGPRSFTGEDVVELHCHGGQVAVRRVLAAVLRSGARLAEPGEFTRRAFVNGRMDLSQAEAVIEIIRAKTDRAMDAAVNQLNGGLKDSLGPIRSRLLEMMAHLEAEIDFPELHLAVEAEEQVVDGCTWSLQQINGLLAGARRGKLLREGVRVVLAGRPNVGKSSLLNWLVRENRAIVTAIPGTTRDVIEEWVNIQGFPVVLVDTAGIRETVDLIESLGVVRSREMLARADLVLLIVEGPAGVTAEDRQLIKLLPPGVNVVAVANKMDLDADVPIQSLQEALFPVPVLAVSAVTGLGMEKLEEQIAAACGMADKEESFLANARQEEALRQAAIQLDSALSTMRANMGSDLVSIDLKGAWITLGEITGESVGEELLDQIFSRFCIGK